MFEQRNIQISKISPNTGQIPDVPKNPRFIKDGRFEKLVQSIKDFPEMLELRELIVFPHPDHKGNYIAIAGNMRLRALKEVGAKTAPCKILPENYPSEKIREIVIKDNVSFGDSDFDLLANEWNDEELDNWGVDIPRFGEPSHEELIGEEKNKPATMKITFKSLEQLQKAEIDIKELIDRKYQGAYFSVSVGEI